MKRAGRTLQVLKDGHPRRLADGRNAFKKMSQEQRYEYINWIALETGGQAVFTNQGRSFTLVADLALLGEEAE